ncbi:MAG: DUF1553 domain-containing protein [Armatimonadetes bacterium]|nr:DUF1553 domain-containing protein [Armatimonadota bacterium]
MKAWLVCGYAFGALLPVGMGWAGASSQTQKQVTFSDVEPILKAHCSGCHAGSGASAGLDLSTFESLMKGGASGKAIAPGKPGGSLLLKRLLGEGGMPQMPMGMPALSESQIATIRAWVQQGASKGASSKQHWAFAPVRRLAPPKVKLQGWTRNPIDAFVLKRLETAGLKPSHEASKEALIRRVSLDLTGLPPTPQEIDAFLADKRPDAYERVVDRLLKSPHYGEKQAIEWLDLARYADSNGFEKDNNRVAFKYRDWVIDAFNRNLPYDQFVVKQLAGDLLPKPTLDDLIATGFHRNTMFNQEGGVDPEEGLFEALVDRVSTTGVVFMGVTFGCARCHDHKYDPFKQREFYELLAYFNGTDYVPKGDPKVSEMKYYEPEIEAPTPEQAAERDRLKARLADLEAKLTAQSPELTAEQGRWTAAVASGIPWLALFPTAFEATNGVSLALASDNALLASGPIPAKVTYRVRLERPSTNSITGIRIEALANDALPNKGPGRSSNGNFVVGKVAVLAGGKPIKLAAAKCDFDQESFSAQGLIDDDPDSGWAISPQMGKPHEAVLEFARPLVLSSDSLEVVIECESRFGQHTLGAFRLSATSIEAPLVRFASTELRDLARKENRTAVEQRRLDAAFRAATPLLSQARQDKAASEKRLAEVQSQIPTALIMRDRPGPLSAHLRNRGEFTNRGDQVFPAIPAAWNKPTSGSPANRLGLAQWIVSKQNPLTARVQMNRMWMGLFGRGIVETAENFGTQASPPSHPELLDWLASEFMARNWDMKAMMRLMATSAAYRQSSDATRQALAKDPGNALISRGPRFRLDAELVRDNALAASGLLSRKLGGPSVYPIQPDGVWNTPYNGQQWMTSQKDDRYRRGLYTFLKRTSPYPSFMTFDSTSRESCTVRRVRTNTPLQALTLLNDPVYLEAASALAARSEREAGKDPAKRLSYAFRLCTGRRPSEPELKRLAKLLSRLKAKAGPSAKSGSKTPDQAAWQMVCSVLLNLDETITKG